MIRNSSEHEDYPEGDGRVVNIYPLSLKEAYINQNDETYEVNGETYYIWKRWEQDGDGSFDSDYSVDDNIEGEFYLLTKTLEPQLPLILGESEDVYVMLSDDLNGDNFEGISQYLTEQGDTFIALAKKYDNGSIDIDMANVKARLYSITDETDFYEGKRVDNRLNDYYEYDGDTIEWDGETCYVWYRYDSNMKVRDYVFGNAGSRYTEEEFLEDYGDNSKAILTNTLWINNLPLNADSPEYVATINFKDEVYDGVPEHLSGDIDRIEYLTEQVGENILNCPVYFE